MTDNKIDSLPCNGKVFGPIVARLFLFIQTFDPQISELRNDMVTEFLDDITIVPMDLSPDDQISPLQ
jgi:hypothetical protein